MADKYDIPFAYALYEDGHFEKYRNCKDGYMMLIDLGKSRNTIMSNPNTTFDAEKYAGHFWEKSSVDNTGNYLVVDDDFVVHLFTNVTEEDFENMDDNYYSGIMNIEKGKPFFYYDRKNGSWEEV